MKCKLCKATYKVKNTLNICLECDVIYQHYYKKLWNMDFVVDKQKLIEWLIADFCVNCEEYKHDDDRGIEVCNLGEKPITCQLIRGMV